MIKRTRRRRDGKAGTVEDGLRPELQRDQDQADRAIAVRVSNLHLSYAW